MTDKILVIAPHADDGVLGCGGMMARRIGEGAKVHVVVAAIGGLKHRHLKQAATLAQRQRELERAADILGVTETTVLYEGMDMKLDTIPQLDLVTRLDKILDQNYYEEVYFPYFSHNHDHQAVFRATYAALRLTADREAPRLSALYEYGYIGWTPAEVRGGKLYVDITQFLETKIRALKAYESQLRPFPHPCSPSVVRILAAMRGLESGCAAAELFYLQKMVLCKDDSVSQDRQKRTNS